MRVFVNEEPRETSAHALMVLLEELGVSQEWGVAVALNGIVVPRATWATQTLQEGCQILIIKAAQGG
jgi:sulfur carrier protein